MRIKNNTKNVKVEIKIIKACVFYKVKIVKLVKITICDVVDNGSIPFFYQKGIHKIYYSKNEYNLKLKFYLK